MPTGLVLTGGGARGAWQAGVLAAIAEWRDRPTLPFPLLSGTSAGSINAAYLAARADDFPAAGRGLVRMWSELRPNRVFRTDTASMAKIGASWLADLGLGGVFGSGRGKALLDTTPLRGLLGEVFDAEATRRHLASGALDGLAFSATRYDTGMGMAFYAARRQVAPWERRTRLSMATRLEVEHALASSAIPIFFPAVFVENAWYGDGCVRMHTPLSPAIHLGATHLLALGVQHPPGTSRVRADSYPSKAQTAGLLLDALFMDALDADVERATRINRTLSLLGEQARSAASPLRPLDVLLLQPSQDLGGLGRDALSELPAFLRHMLKGLGASAEEGWELVSYLAFDPAYTRPLIDAGRADAEARKDEILAFLERARAADAGLPAG